jgi:hypothetical protein
VTNSNNFVVFKTIPQIKTKTRVVVAAAVAVAVAVAVCVWYRLKQSQFQPFYSQLSEALVEASSQFYVFTALFASLVNAPAYLRDRDSQTLDPVLNRVETTLADPLESTVCIPCDSHLVLQTLDQLRIYHQQEPQQPPERADKSLDMSAHGKRQAEVVISTVATSDEEFAAHLAKPGLRGKLILDTLLDLTFMFSV